MRLPDSSVGGVRRAVPDSERALPLGSSFRWPGTTTNCPSLGDFVRGESLSDMQPTHRIAEPEDIAQAALWLASEGSGFVNGHAGQFGACAARIERAAANHDAVDLGNQKTLYFLLQSIS